ncbi:protein FAR1-related sequence 5, partial [Tanacetum coccineum]
PVVGNWNINTGTSFHLNDYISSVSDVFNLCIYPPVSVGDEHSIPVTGSFHSILATQHRPLHINNVLITPNILNSVRQFVRDNFYTVEFDAFGFSVKDFLTRRVLLRCDSTGDLYPVTKPSTMPHAFLTTWHQRLGHPRSEVLCHVLSSNSISCNKEKHPVLCPACQLGKHKSYSEAFNDPNWKNAMTGEYNALVKNKTWTIVHRPTDAYIVRCMWSFRHKYLANDTLSCYKARLVANDSSRSMLDVKNAFMHGDLFETVYMHQPLEYQDSIHPHYVCLLQRSLYGIKQGPRAWFQGFAAYITHVGFAHSRYSKCLVEGSEVCIIKESPYVYEMPNKKKKKPQSVDKGNDKAEENDKVDLFFKKDGLYKVLRNVGDGSVVCSCQLFVRVGILCKHIFCVFKNANVEMIPQQYILRRWTKNLIPAALRNKRNRYGEKNVVVENYANEATSIVDHCVHLLSKDEPRLGAFVEKLKSLKKEVEADCPNPPSKNKTDNLEQLVGVPKPSVVDVNNPTVGSTKGRKKLRIKGGKEKAIEKSLKGRNSCSLCGGTDHNKRTCPRRFEGQDEVVFQKEVGQEEVLVQKEVCQEEVVQEKVDLAEDEEELSEEDEGLIHE